MPSRQSCILIARQIVALWLLALPTASCLGQGVTEGELKASYLVNFLKYVEWPEPQASLRFRTICFYGLDNVGSYLTAYEGRIINGRELQLRRLVASDTLEGCHELYIPAIAEERIGAILRSSANLPILTVSDAETFAHHGGSIALIRNEGRYQFDINAGALSRAGIKAGSPLLRLARQIVGRSTEMNHYPRPLFILTILAILTLAGKAHAALDPIELPLEELLKIRILSTPKFAEDPDKISTTTSILTADDIRTFGWRTLTDALRSLQGFNVTDDHTYTFAGTRGISVPGDFRARMQVLIDGVAINENIYASTLIDSAFPLDIDLIERIEVIRGPSASVYGGDSMFGVINVVTRSGQSLSGPELGLAYGSGNQRQARLSWGGRVGDNHLVVSLSGFDAAGHGLTFNDTDASGLDQRIQGIRAEQGKRLFIQARGADWRLTLIHGQRERTIPHGSYGAIPGDDGHTETDSFTAFDLSKDWHLNSRTTLQQRLYSSAYGYDGRFPYDYSPVDPRIVNVDKARGSLWGIENRLVTTAWAGQRWIFGLEYQAHTRMDQLNYDEGHGCYGFSSTPCLDDHRHGYRFSLYAQDEVQIGTASTLSLGLRFDRQADFGTTWSPRIGFVHDADRAGIFKLLYGTAFRNPSVYELAYTMPAFLYGNPTLDPEKMRSLELAWEKRFGRSARLTTTLYRFTIDQMIMTDAAGTATNGQEVQATGLEVEYEHQWMNGIRLRTGITVQDSKNEFGRMDNSPRHMAKFNLGIPTMLAGLTAGIEGQWIGTRLANLGSEKISSYTLVNLNLSYVAPNKAWDAGLGIYNLFDHRYADPVAVDAALPITRWYMPQLGRTLQLRTRVSF